MSVQKIDRCGGDEADGADRDRGVGEIECRPKAQAQVIADASAPGGLDRMAQRSAEKQRGAPLGSGDLVGQCQQRTSTGEPGDPEHWRRWPESAALPPDRRINDAHRAQWSE